MIKERINRYSIGDKVVLDLEDEPSYEAYSEELISSIMSYGWSAVEAEKMLIRVRQGGPFTVDTVQPSGDYVSNKVRYGLRWKKIQLPGLFEVGHIRLYWREG